MGDFLNTAMTVFSFAVCGVLLLAIIAFYAVAVYKGAAKIVRRLCHKRAALGLFVVAAVAIIHGGTKNILPRFTSDPGLQVVEATMNRATNETETTTLAVKWVGPDESAPINVRDSVHDRWTALAATSDGWLYDDRFYDNGTNTVYFWIDPGVAASNATIWAQWHLGTDLPPVEIDGEGVTIEAFTATSKYVAIRYAVNPSALTGAGVVTIEAQRRNQWDELYRLPISAPVTNLATFAGFWVGETTRWRVRLEVNQ